MFRTLLSLGLVAAVAFAMPASAADIQPKEPTGSKVQVTKMFRSSTLVGMKVMNPQNEQLGAIDDLVINVENGRVSYAALSVGGFLGLGDKLFAVPWSEFTLTHTEKDTFLVLDMNKEKLKAAPGFDKDHWPNVADPNWSQEVDKYYRQRVAERERAKSTK